MATGGNSGFGVDPDLGRHSFTNPVWAEDEGLNGFFMAPAAYRLALANDRARSMTPLESPMVPLDPPSPDVTYDHRRDKAERMDRKRERYLRPQAPAIAPVPRHVLETILQDSATAMAEFPADFRRLILQSCLHYGMETF